VVRLIFFVPLSSIVQTLDSLTSLTLVGHFFETHSTLPASLETLPDELLSAVFHHFGSFVLPSLCKRLLPFHRSQLYRNVALDLDRFERFRSAVESNPALLPFVEVLTLKFNSERNPREDLNSKIPRRDVMGNLLASLPNLKTFSLGVDGRLVLPYYPKVSDFNKNPRLEMIDVRSYFYKEEEALSARNNDIFDWPVLRKCTGGVRFTRMGEILYEDQSDPKVVVELKKTSTASFALRYYSGESTEISIHNLLRSTPLSSVKLVVFTHKLHLDRLLSNIGHPSLITYLSLFSFDITTTRISPQDDFLLRFPNLATLALGGTSAPISDVFYESLRPLPLEALLIGPRTTVRIQPIIDLLSHSSKPNLTNLKRLVLNNVYAYAPKKEKEDYANSWDWEFPEWTTECSKDKVKELKELAKRLEIKIGGTTFRGLSVVRSKAYMAALRREEEEEEDDEDRRYSDSDDEEFADWHDDYCGCHRAPTNCWRFSDYMGWPRRNYRRNYRNRWY